MISDTIKNFRASAELPVAQGSRIFAVGPINSNPELLEAMLSKIENEGQLAKDDLIVFMGGMIGKSGNTRRVFQLLKQYGSKRAKQMRLIRGRNEELFLDSTPNFYATEEGKNLIDSYRGRNYYTNCSSYASKRVDVRDVVEDRFWLECMAQHYLKTNRYFMCHGGPKLRNDKTPDKDIDDVVCRALVFGGMYDWKKTSEKMIVNVHANEKSSKASNHLSLGQADKMIACMVLKDYEDKEAKDPYVAELFAVRESIQKPKSG